MKTITEKLEEIIKVELLKNSDDKNIKEFEELLEQMEKLGYLKKPEYNLPLVDTIGKFYYLASNKHLSV
jgi:RNA-binding protein YhbY